MADWALILQETMNELLVLLKAPFLMPEMWWVITPLIIVTLLMTFYFGKYSREKLGWNTALSNSIVLFFVGIDLLRTIYHYTTVPSLANFVEHPVKIVLIIAVMIEAVLISYTAFTHALPASIVFFIASPLSINIQAYLLAAVVYTRLRPTWYTLLAVAILFATLLSTFKLLQEVEHLVLGYHSKKARK